MAPESPIPLAVHNITDQGITSKSELFKFKFKYCYLILILIDKDVEFFHSFSFYGKSYNL